MFNINTNIVFASYLTLLVSVSLKCLKLYVCFIKESLSSTFNILKVNEMSIYG